MPIGKIETYLLFLNLYLMMKPAGDWGWYNDDGSAGYHIINLRAKGINRYSGDKLIELKICKHKYCVC